MGVSAYLLYIHWSKSSALCSGFGGCELVNSSPYSEVGGVPVALLGITGYALILLLSLWQSGTSAGTSLGIALALLGLSLIGVLYSAYLTYVELFVIKAVCPWCVASALLITGIFAASWKGVVS